MRVRHMNPTLRLIMRVWDDKLVRETGIDLLLNIEVLIHRIGRARLVSMAPVWASPRRLMSMGRVQHVRRPSRPIRCWTINGGRFADR